MPEPRAPASGGEMQDEELVNAAMGGDERAFRVLMEKYTPLAASCFYGTYSGGSGVEDFLQEVFVKAYRNLGKLRHRDKVGPWLGAIARNTARSFHTRNMRSGMSRLRINADGTGPLDTLADPGPGPDESAHRSEVELAILSAIGKQKERFRRVVYLSIFEQKTSREISGLLGIKESTVRTQLQRGLESLRQNLKRAGFKPGAE